MRDRVTLLLDVFGLLLLAAGATAAVYPLIGWAGLIPAGVVIVGGVRLAEYLGRRGAAS
jgi:hypothetical protein